MTDAEREQLDMAVMKVLAVHGTRSAVEALLNIYPRVARNSVQRLIAAGRVELVSERRGQWPARYKVIWK